MNFKEGDLVRLRSGSNLMTVYFVSNTKALTSIYCFYSDNNGIIHKTELFSNSLILCNEERNTKNETI